MRPSYLFAAAIAVLASSGLAQESTSTGPYKILKTAKVGGSGGYDYVNADAEADAYTLREPAPASSNVYNLDTLGTGRARWPDHQLAWSGCRCQVRSRLCQQQTDSDVRHEDADAIKTIDVQGNPDGMLFDKSDERVYVLSHSAPHVTVIDAKDGAVLGTVDIGGMPEQAATDGKGHLYIDVEDKANIAVVDTKTLTRHRPLRCRWQRRHLRGARAGCEESYSLCRLPQPGKHGDPECGRREDHRHLADRDRHGRGRL